MFHFQLTLGDQMHEYNGLAVLCKVLLLSNPCHRGSVNVQILVTMIDCRATHHLALDLMLLLWKLMQLEFSTQLKALCIILPSPIFSLVFNTNSGVLVERCWAMAFMQRPLPRVCSPKTSTAGSSTGTFEPTRSLNSQYANWHQPVSCRSGKFQKYKIVKTIK